MILYFSGTGNSKYAAKRIGDDIQDEAVNLFDRIRKHDFTSLHSDKPWVVVTPTYAWRIPRILQAWLRRVELSGSRDIWFVMTCGGDIGNAGEYLNRYCKEKGLHNQGCRAVVMPENYIALYDAPGREEALEIIQKADKTLSDLAQYIRDGRPFPEAEVVWKDKIKSGLVNDIFYPAIVHAKKFYATEACISCGKCEKVCPLANIRIDDGKPVWGDDCTHCMACICRCPKEAIEYGRNSKGKVRYVCPRG